MKIYFWQQTKLSTTFVYCYIAIKIGDSAKSALEWYPYKDITNDSEWRISFGMLQRCFCYAYVSL